LVNLVFYKVLTIVVISNFIWNFNTSVGLNCDLEDITTRFTVLAFVVTSLNNEFNWLTNSLVFEKTWSKCKRFESASVHKIGEGNKCSSKFVSED